MRSGWIRLREPRYALRVPAIWLLILMVCLAALPIALLPLPYAVGLVGAVLVGTVALIKPIWALYGAVLSVALQELVHLPGGLTVTQALVMVSASTWILRVLAAPERPIRFGRIWSGLVILLLALFLSTLTTPYSRVEALKETLRWSTVALIYLLTYTMLSESQTDQGSQRWRIIGLVICLLLAPTASALVGIWQFVTGSGPPSFAIAEGRFVRAYGTIGKPNSFAGYLNMAWPLAVALTLGVSGYVRRLARERRAQEISAQPLLRRHQAILIICFCGAASAILLMALFGSFSRGGWMGGIAGFAAMAGAAWIGWDRALRRSLWNGIALAGAGLVLLLTLGSVDALPQPVIQRVQSMVQNLRLFDVRTVQATPENFAVLERMAHLQAGWNMFSQYPLTGVGPGNFTLAYEGRGNMVQPFGIHPWYVSRGHAHNYYLNMAAEAGIIGLLAYLGLLGLLIVQAYGTLRRSNGWFQRSVAIGGCGIIAAVSIHNLFENLHVLNMGVQLAAVWALLASMEQGELSNQTVQ